jgi:hypothetical protein
MFDYNADSSNREAQNNPEQDDGDQDRQQVKPGTGGKVRKVLSEAMTATMLEPDPKTTAITGDLRGKDVPAEFKKFRNPRTCTLTFISPASDDKSKILQRTFGAVPSRELAVKNEQPTDEMQLEEGEIEERVEERTAQQEKQQQAKERKKKEFIHVKWTADSQVPSMVVCISRPDNKPDIDFRIFPSSVARYNNDSHGANELMVGFNMTATPDKNLVDPDNAHLQQLLDENNLRQISLQLMPAGVTQCPAGTDQKIARPLWYNISDQEVKDLVRRWHNKEMLEPWENAVAMLHNANEVVFHERINDNDDVDLYERFCKYMQVCFKQCCEHGFYWFYTKQHDGDITTDSEPWLDVPVPTWLVTQWSVKTGTNYEEIYEPSKWVSFNRPLVYPDAKTACTAQMLALARGIKAKQGVDLSVRRQHAACALAAQGLTRDDGGVDWDEHLLDTSAVPCNVSRNAWTEEIKQYQGLKEDFLREARMTFQLNDKQLEFTKHFLENDTGVSILVGPSGSGKSHSMVAIIMLYLTLNRDYRKKLNKSGPAKKLLVTAPSNVAVDELLSKCLKHSFTFDGMKLIRLKSINASTRAKEDVTMADTDGDTEDLQSDPLEAAYLGSEGVELGSSKSDLQAELIQYEFSHDFQHTLASWPKEHPSKPDATAYTSMLQDLQNPKLELSRARRILLTTEIGVVQQRLYAAYFEEVDAVFCTLNSGMHNILRKHFDPTCIIIDDAARALLRDKLTGIAPHVKTLENVVLGGDPEQMRGRIRDLGRNEFFEIVQDSLVHKVWKRAKVGKEAGFDFVQLQLQYNMDSEIKGPISDTSKKRSADGLGGKQQQWKKQKKQGKQKKQEKQNKAGSIAPLSPEDVTKLNERKVALPDTLDSLAMQAAMDEVQNDITLSSPLRVALVKIIQRRNRG